MVGEPAPPFAPRCLGGKPRPIPVHPRGPHRPAVRDAGGPGATRGAVTAPRTTLPRLPHPRYRPVNGRRTGPIARHAARGRTARPQTPSSRRARAIRVGIRGPSAPGPRARPGGRGVRRAWHTPGAPPPRRRSTPWGIGPKRRPGPPTGPVVAEAAPGTRASHPHPRRRRPRLPPVHPAPALGRPHRRGAPLRRVPFGRERAVASPPEARCSHQIRPARSLRPGRTTDGVAVRPRRPHRTDRLQEHVASPAVPTRPVRATRPPPPPPRVRC